MTLGVKLRNRWGEEKKKAGELQWGGYGCGSLHAHRVAFKNCRVLVSLVLCSPAGLKNRPNKHRPVFVARFQAFNGRRAGENCFSLQAQRSGRNRRASALQTCTALLSGWRFRSCIQRFSTVAVGLDCELVQGRHFLSAAASTAWQEEEATMNLDKGLLRACASSMPFSKGALFLSLPGIAFQSLPPLTGSRINGRFGREEI